MNHFDWINKEADWPVAEHSGRRTRLGKCWDERKKSLELPARHRGAGIG